MSFAKIFLLFYSVMYSLVVPAQFRVIGYVQPWGEAPDVSRIAFDKLTHLNIAFVNPDSSGNLVLPPGLDTLIITAHTYNVKVLASIGGGSRNPYYARLLMDANRTALVNKLVTLSVDYDLDGIDVDLEGEAIDKNYDKLIADLSAALKPLGKLLTAAFATWNAGNISNTALKKFDFINIMSYDQTGPWRPNEPGQHSTYSKAEEDLNYWTVTRGFSKKKINLGLPFYGYCFGTKYGESMSWEQIIEKFPGSAFQDVVVPENGGIIYYNGITTIKSKVILAQKKAGGVMIWQLLHDSPGSNSLLDAITDTIKETLK
jgi:chitinase